MALTTLNLIDAAGFYGTRRYDSYETDQVEPQYMKSVMMQKPNGFAALTAISDMIPGISVPNAKVDWYEENMPTIQSTTVLYTDAALTAAAGTRTAGTLVYAKISAAFAAKFRARMGVRFSVTNTPESDCTGWVEEVVINGASSYLKVRMLVTTTLGATLVNVAQLANVNPDGSYLPDGVSYNEVARYNYCHTLRWPIKIDRRTYRQKFRTPEAALVSERRKTLFRATREMENAILFSEASNTLVDGKRMTTMEGILPSIRNHALGNEANFFSTTDTAYANFAWDQKGEQFIDDYMEQIFHYGDTDERVCYCGSGFLGGINTIAKMSGSIQLVPGATKYGTNVTTWVSPHGTVHFRKHPLFTEDINHRFSGLFIQPDKIEKYTLDPLQHRTLISIEDTDEAGFDGVVEEWIGDFCVALENVDHAFILDGVGLNNTTYVAP